MHSTRFHPNLYICKNQKQLLDVSTISEAGINTYVTVPLTQNQFDALVSYVFNCGVNGGLVDTQLLARLNEGNYEAAAAEMDINTSGGVFVQGLENRRIAERNLFLNGY